jgi:MFS family permease
MILIGVGLGFSFVPISIAALAGATSGEAGLQSGLINTVQQIGGALGLAILTTVATTRTNDLLRAGVSHAEAAVRGYSLAFWVGVGFSLAGFAATLILLKRDDLRATVPESVPVSDIV